METQPVRISKTLLDKIRKLGQEIGNPTVDTTLRIVFEQREKLIIENEVLRRKLDDCERRKNK